jgi:hypothetical protein
MVLEDLDPADWHDDAMAAIIGLANDLPEFTCDDLRREMRPAPHANHYGAAFLAAKTAGFIEPVSYTTSANKTRRRGSLRTWRRKIEGVAA